MAAPFRISKTRSLRLRQGKNSTGRRNPTRTQRFDKSSGLIYDEVVMAASMEIVPWKHASKEDPERVKRLCNSPRSWCIEPKEGNFSLQDLSVRAAVFCIDRMDAETLAGCPEHLVRAVWKHLCRHSLETVHAWTAIKIAHPDLTGVRRVFETEPLPAGSLPMDQLLLPAQAPRGEWLVSLSLHNFNCSIQDLTRLSDLTNLGVLLIGTLCGEIVDGIPASVARSWVETADESGAFSKLRVLACRYQHCNPRSEVARILSRLPVLHWLVLMYDERTYVTTDLAPGHLIWREDTNRANELMRPSLIERVPYVGLFTLNSFYRRIRVNTPDHRVPILFVQTDLIPVSNNAKYYRRVYRPSSLEEVGASTTEGGSNNGSHGAGRRTLRVGRLRQIRDALSEFAGSSATHQAATG